MTDNYSLKEVINDLKQNMLLGFDKIDKHLSLLEAKIELNEKNINQLQKDHITYNNIHENIEKLARSLEKRVQRIESENQTIDNTENNISINPQVIKIILGLMTLLGAALGVTQVL